MDNKIGLLEILSNEILLKIFKYDLNNRLLCHRINDLLCKYLSLKQFVRNTLHVDYVSNIDLSQGLFFFLGCRIDNLPKKKINIKCIEILYDILNKKNTKQSDFISYIYLRFVIKCPYRIKEDILLNYFNVESYYYASTTNSYQDYKDSINDLLDAIEFITSDKKNQNLSFRLF
jgi:hypothetical protein